MYKNVRNKLVVCTVFLLAVSFRSDTVKAQFSLAGQLRPRGEIRDGYGNLVPSGAKQAGFISQRTRLSFRYKWDFLTFGVSIQDVRIWGADASTVSAVDGNRFMLHEGWAELTLANRADTNIKFKLVDQLSFKIGRQELIYDDARLMGNLDWLQQGRRHDMALLKLLHHGWQADFGYAYNQNSDGVGLTNTNYVPGNLPAFVKNSLGTVVPLPAGLVPLAPGGNAANNSAKGGIPVYSNPVGTNGATQNYKSFTSLYISRKFRQTKVSALFFNDNFGKYKLDSIGSPAAGYVYGRRFVAGSPSDTYNYGTNSRYTYGLMVNPTFGNTSGLGKVAIQAAYYRQSGDDRDGNRMNAFHYSLAATYQKGLFSITPGYDVLSGTRPDDVILTKNNSFDPLYGTPHKFWGYMDYFYAGSGSPKGGLNNPYVKLKYTANTFAIGLDLHAFSLNQDMKKADGSLVGRNLGKEADLLLNYSMNKFTNIELGYSMMKATSSMPFAKGQALNDAAAAEFDKTPKWAYLMIRFSPDFLSSKP